MSIVLHGVAAGKGIAIGRAHLLVRGMDEVPQYDIAEQEIASEVQRFHAAIAATRAALENIGNTIPEHAPTEFGAFISLHLMLLADPTLASEPADIIREQKINAEWALKIQTDKLVQQFDQISDDYLRQRKQDLLQVVERIHNQLIGQNELDLDVDLWED
ncbi:MAG: phosphoenolpyruvate-utilizing N-terminal domain-containing protein, partial [Neisseria sp.]|nr:phosphoenolpyruvate-utilizing N-terminal domain-containing protein [Neisseria sp.]